jgi:hypothetical protein
VTNFSNFVHACNSNNSWQSTYRHHGSGSVLMSCLIWSFWSAARNALWRAFFSSCAEAASVSELLVRRAVAWSMRRSASARTGRQRKNRQKNR